MTTGELSGQFEGLANLTSAGPNRPDEPFAATASLERAIRFLDEAALNFTNSQGCGTCHTNIAYMIGRAVMGRPTPAQGEVRKFFEDRASRWDSMDALFVEGDRDTKGYGLVFWFPTEVVVTAAMLAMDDAGTTGTLQPLTRQVLDRMWTLQRYDGGFDWIMAGNLPFESSAYYGAALAAVATAGAPGGYAETDAARRGLERLRTHLKKYNTPLVPLHDRIYVLWAASRIPNLMTEAEKDEIIDRILALQRPDGGWSLPSLGPSFGRGWERRDGTLNDPAGSPSDGYGTGLVTYVLLQTGRPATDPVIRRALDWLETHQRESGRWFTRSLNADRLHFITHTGTVFSAMALKAAGYECC